ncbi:MAG: tRNA (adenosine(37)-N6)-threonylcarbamoyltransferase complex transferase subunit TsaD [Acidobacteriota bacterium]|nr:tRNA (adenosine(37)-N6)-threonylcarbamoyltransferase complex transferase subunit TsaD [Acidobacteriota bacterium]
MQILGIETSCDETAAAVVAETDDPARPWAIRSSVVASQVPIHREWGGVVPELASRQHVRDICGVVEKALEEADTGLDGLDAIAVTQGPGLVGSLLVGLSFAKSLAASRGLPLVPVHHLAGHIESLFLQHGPLPLPAIVLVVSGGHTNLYRVDAPGHYHPLSRTRDDAAGEAYDKVARLLGLGYPGGPVIDRLAKQGNDRAVDLPIARMTHADRNAPFDPGQFDFSFSGVKTAVLRYVKGRTAGEAARQAGRRGTVWAGAEPEGQALPAQDIADVCASFQRVVVEALLDRTFAAAERWHARSVGIAGGVSANSRLRADAAARGEAFGLPVYVPTIKLSTDNAAMIAAAGLRAFRAGVRADWRLNADASLDLAATTPPPSPSPHPGQ